MRSPKTPIRAVACVAGLCLVLVQAALAADKRPISFNASDQAAAKAVTIKAADLGPGWKGGATKPDLTPDEMCPMKISDLVLTGAAKSEFTGQGAVIHSESEVLQSPGLVGADWRRSVGNPTFMACISREMMKMDEAKVVSFKKVAFPKLTQYSARYRTVADVGKPGSSVRVLMDLVLLGQGRTEISLLVSTRYADRAQADIAERNLAVILISRIRA